MSVRHPAKYTNALIPVMAKFVQNCTNIIDPFAGTGKAFEIYNYGYTGKLTCIELEPEWASAHPDVIVGNALCLDFPDNTFNGGLTSCAYANRMADHHEAKDGSRRNTYRHALGRPLHSDNSGQMQWGCVAPGHLVLCADWQWRPVEQLIIGDAIVGFDENVEGEGNVRNRGRRWKTGYVESVATDRRPCVEITFDDGYKVVCTEDHPWLARRASNNYPRKRDWIIASNLRPQDEVGVYFDTWKPVDTWESGWLAGIFDGEGSWIPSGSLVMAQNPGKILRQANEFLHDMGFDCVVESRAYSSANTLRVRGGLPEHARFMGTIRPVRLLDKSKIDGHYMRAIKERTVCDVKRIGLQDVVLMGTSCDTYVVDGMGSHNTKYREFHLRAWAELKRVLQNNSIFVLNIKNHIRKNQEARVTEWHTECLSSLGFVPVEHVKINCPGNRFGKNYQLRIEYESVIKFILSK